MSLANYTKSIQIIMYGIQASQPLFISSFSLKQQKAMKTVIDTVFLPRWLQWTSHANTHCDVIWGRWRHNACLCDWYTATNIEKISSILL